MTGPGPWPPGPPGPPNQPGQWQPGPPPWQPVPPPWQQPGQWPPQPTGGPLPPPVRPGGRPGRWVPIAVVAALVVLLAGGVVAFLTLSGDDGTAGAAGTTSAAPTSSEPTTTAPTTSPPRTTPLPPPPTTTQPAPTTPAGPPAADLQGSWSGSGALATCQGFGDACPAELPITLGVDCPAGPQCFLTPFGPPWPSAPLLSSGGGFNARGSVPLANAPTCNGAPSFGAQWRLEVTVEDGRLVGRYTETTSPDLSCGATTAAWDVTFTRA